MARLGAFVPGSLAMALAWAIGCSSDEAEDSEIDPGSSGGSAWSGGGSATGGTGGGGGFPVRDSGVGGTGGLRPCAELRGLEECGYTTREAQTAEVNVLLVMDKSGSMTEQPEGYTVTKWEALETALSVALNNVKGVVSFGLELFPTTATPGSPIPELCDNGSRCCEMPPGSDMNVAIGPGTETVPELIQALQGSGPAGGTPTAMALARAYEYFTVGGGAALQGDRIILLATDGGPNCNESSICTVDTCTLNLDDTAGCPPAGPSCCDTTPAGCLDHEGTIARIEQLFDIGVRTIVVGIPGAEIYAANLQQFADAGGFERPDGSTDYFGVPVSGGVQALTDTFRTITIQLVTDCEVPLEGEIPNLNQINVAVDCNIIPKKTDPTAAGDGWYFNDLIAPTSIIIDGPICTEIQESGVQRIDTVFGCPTVDIG